MLARKAIVGRAGQYEEGSSLIVTKPVHPWPSLSQAQPVHMTLRLTAAVGRRLPQAFRTPLRVVWHGCFGM
jgi:hypothetical protein